MVLEFGSPSQYEPCLANHNTFTSCYLQPLAWQNTEGLSLGRLLLRKIALSLNNIQNAHKSKVADSI